jgi:lipopolysaccharide transport system ATP-binding protein
LNAAILGMRRADIARKFDAIVAFAEIDGFIDTPVKRFSSGMFVRLAFAVAAHLEPEILLVDEVLAVGDAGFQRKCLGTIDTAVRAGRTVVFVSHDMGAVTALSRRAVLIDRGRVRAVGPAREVVHGYLRSLAEASGLGTRDLRPPDSLPVAVTALRTTGPDGKPTAVVTRSAAVAVTVEGEVRRRPDPGQEYFVAIDVRGAEGELLFRTHNVEQRERASVPDRLGAFALTCVLPPDLLPAGSYRIGLVSGIAGKVELQDVPTALSLDVVQDHLLAGLWTGTSGLLTPRCEWREG